MLVEGVSVQMLEHCVNHEWTKTAEDFLFRRTKLGLHLSKEDISQIEAWFESQS